MANPIAMFDLLTLAAAIKHEEQKVHTADIHLFAYLACLLSVYKGHPASDWGYRFAGTESGAPFASELVNAINLATRAGWLHVDPDGFLVQLSGVSDELIVFKSLDNCNWHQEFLEAAVSTLLNLSAGLIRTAVSEEPNLKPVARTGRKGKLLEGVALDLLYEQFDALISAVGKQADLFVPASVWLTFLARHAARVGS